MFNYQKLALCEAKIKELEEMLRTSRNVASIESQLREQTSALYDRFLLMKDQQITDQREEILNLRGKISLMETVMLPLHGTREGRAYAEALNPPPEKPSFKPLSEPVTNEWQKYKRQQEAKLAAEYDEDAKKETTNA